MKTSVILCALLLAACSSKPLAPSWQADAKDAIDAYTDDYLRGHGAAAEADFARARRETASTGRADLVAQVELVRCAARAASLEFADCPGFAALAPDATAQQRAYAAYLAGRWEGLDAALLPEQHRPVVAQGRLPAAPIRWRSWSPPARCSRPDASPQATSRRPPKPRPARAGAARS